MSASYLPFPGVIKTLAETLKKMGMSGTPLPWDGVASFMAGYAALQAKVDPVNALAIGGIAHWIVHDILVERIIIN